MGTNAATQPRIIMEFVTAAAAREYRQQHGTGGWIFCGKDGTALLFPFNMSPSAIFVHWATKDRTGTLI